MRLCDDARRACESYLDEKDRGYVTSSRPSDADHAISEGLLDVVRAVNCPDWTLEFASTVRVARCLVNEKGMKPRELINARSVEVLRYFVCKGFSYSSSLYDALAVEGRVDVLRFAITNGPPLGDKEALLRCAMASSSLESVRYVHEELGAAWSEGATAAAATYGHLHLIHYARSRGCPLDRSCLKESLSGGHLSCFVYACEQLHAVPNDKEVAKLIKRGHVALLKYAVEQRGSTLPARACDLAAQHAGVEMLAFLRGAGCCDFDAHTCEIAAGRRSPEILMWLHKHGCAWDTRTCTAAAATRSLEMLRYAHENGCAWDVSALMAAVAPTKKAHSACCGWILLDVVRARRFAVFAYLVDNDCPWHPFVYLIAMNEQATDCVEYAISKGKKADERVSALAAVYSAHLLRLFHEAGCP